MFNITDREYEEKCEGSLRSDEVYDIKSHNSDNQYIIIDDYVITGKESADLYKELLRIMLHSTSVNHIWFSHPPCLPCMFALTAKLNFLQVTPVLHVDLLSLNGSEDENLHDYGCLLKLSRKYKLVEWDWDEFGKNYGGCKYYSDSRYGTQYGRHKINTGLLVTLLEISKYSPLAKICTYDY